MRLYRHAIQVITEEIARNSPGSIGIVLDKDGQVIAHSNSEELGKNYLEETGTLGAALAQILYVPHAEGAGERVQDDEHEDKTDSRE